MKNHKQQNIVLGVIFMLGASLFFSIMIAIIKSLGENLPSSQVLFVRSIIGCSSIALYLKIKKISLVGKHKKELYFRSVIGFLSAICVFYAAARMKISDEAVFVRSSALYVPFMAYILAREKIRYNDIFISIFGFLGILLILKPGVMPLNYAALIALLSAIFQSLAFASVRNLTKLEHPFRIVYYFLFTSSILSLLVGYADFVMPNYFDSIKLLAIAMLGLLGQCCMTMGYSFGPAGLLTPVLYLEIVFSTILGMTYFVEYPDIYSYLGMLIVVLSTLVISRRK